VLEPARLRGATALRGVARHVILLRRAVAAGNRIAGLPYRYGGGHRSFSAAGYDCSGSVSYVLHAIGRLSRPMDSGELMSYGSPGPGRFVTVYANPGHAFMVIDGRRFDTSGRSIAGSRWHADARSTAGYVARHPAGL
jgi:cell wall-associated NlpC family hydrolase